MSMHGFGSMDKGGNVTFVVFGVPSHLRGIKIVCNPKLRPHDPPSLSISIIYPGASNFVFSGTPISIIKYIA